MADVEVELYEWDGDTQTTLGPVRVYEWVDGDGYGVEPVRFYVKGSSTTNPPAQQPVPVAQMPKPFFFAHRGAPGPENTLAGFQRRVNQINIGVECDIFRNASGSMVLNHDSTVDRTWSNGTGAVSGKTDSQWQAGLVRDLDTPGNPDDPASFWADVAGVFGNRYIITAEWKAGGSQYTQLFADVEARGIQDFFIFNSFNETQVTAAAARGLYSALVANSLTTADFTRLAAAGVWGVFVSTAGASQALITAAQNAGLKFFVWTVDTLSQRDTYIARGVDGIITDRVDLLAAPAPAVGDGLAGAVLYPSESLYPSTTLYPRG